MDSIFEDDPAAKKKSSNATGGQAAGPAQPAARSIFAEQQAKGSPAGFPQPAPHAPVSTARPTQSESIFSGQTASSTNVKPPPPPPKPQIWKTLLCVAVGLSVLIVAGRYAIPWIRSWLHHAPAPPPGQIVKRLEGVMNVALTAGKSGGSPNTVQGGWYFIDGQLMGRIPATVGEHLVPGEYEIEGVVVRSNPDSSPDFLSATWTVRVRRGEQTSVQKDLDPQWIAGGCQPDAASDPTLHCYDSNTLLEGSNGPGFDLPDLSSLSQATYGAAYEQWGQFLESAYWQPVANAVQQLELNPPQRRRVWIDLASELGGARELDGDQVRILGEWFHALLQIRLSSASAQVGANQRFLSELAASVGKKEQTSIQWMISRLNETPEQ